MQDRDRVHNVAADLSEGEVGSDPRVRPAPAGNGADGPRMSSAYLCTEELAEEYRDRTVPYDVCSTPESGAVLV